MEYTFELATTSAFNDADIIHTAVTNIPRYTLPDTLIASRNYYLRVSAKFENNIVMANIVRFRTKPQVVPIPTITYPADGQVIEGNQLTVKWQEQPSSGFYVEMSQVIEFPGRFTERGLIEDIDIFSYTFEGLDPGTWYIRVMAMAEGGYTEPSEVVTVTLNTPTATDEMQVLDRPTKLIENGRVYILRNGKTYDILGNSAQ